MRLWLLKLQDSNNETKVLKSAANLLKGWENNKGEFEY